HLESTARRESENGAVTCVAATTVRGAVVIPIRANDQASVWVGAVAVGKRMQQTQRAVGGDLENGPKPVSTTLLGCPIQLAIGSLQQRRTGIHSICATGKRIKHLGSLEARGADQRNVQCRRDDPLTSGYLES